MGKVIRALTMAALLLLVAAAAQAQMSASQRADLFWQAMQDVLANERFAGEAANFRGLGVGSWMNNAATRASDLDFTIGHKSPARERELAKAVQDRVNQLAKSRGIAKADVHVIARTDFKFAERFRGEVGQKFVMDYANRAGPKGAGFAFKVVDGKLVKQRIATTAFWEQLGHEVPKSMQGSWRLIEDMLLFMGTGAGKSPVDAAQSAAKYVSNYEQWMKTTLGKTYGDVSALGSMDEAMRGEYQALLQYKKEAAKYGEQAAKQNLMKRFGVATDTELNLRMKGFFKDSKRYLEKAMSDVEVLERFSRAGMLQSMGGPAKVLSLRNRIGQIVLKHGVAITLAPLELYMVMSAYEKGGAKAASGELFLVLAGHACPPALIGGIVAEVGRQVFHATVVAVGQAFIFDPINDRILRDNVYATDSYVNIFKWDSSPFKGLSRHTIACRFEESDQVRTAVGSYISALKSMGSRVAWFATAGAGAINSSLTNRMLADHRASKNFLYEMTDTGYAMAKGIYEPVSDPFDLVVNGVEAGVGAARFEGEVGPEGPARFTVDLVGRFGFGWRIPADRGSLRDVICEGGLAKAGKWIEANRVEEYRQVYLVDWTVQLQDAGNWRVLGLPSPDEHDAIMSGGMSSGMTTHHITFQPGPEAEPEARAVLTATLAYEEDGRMRTEKRAFTLVARQAQASFVLRVRNAGNNRPISGAKVQLSGPTPRSAYTSSGGAVRFEGLKPGRYTMTVSARDFESATSTGNLSAGEEGGGTVQLTPVQKPETPKVVKPEPRPEPKSAPRPEPKPQLKPEPKPEPKKVEPTSQGPTGQELCNCVNTWNMTVRQAELTAAAKQAEGAAFCGGNQRLSPAFTYDAARDVCTGKVEWFNCSENRREEDRWMVTSSYDGDVNMGAAAHYCEELKKHGVAPKQDW